MSTPGYYAVTKQEEAQVVPLSLAQKGLWIPDHIQTSRHFNTILSVIIIKRPFTVQALQSSFDILLQRHAALRTTFQEAEGQLQQVILPQMQITLPVIDLQPLAGEQREAEIQHQIAEEAERPFDLTHGPLIRARILQLEAEEQILLLSIHRMVCDRWSVNACLRELTDLYEAFASGQSSPSVGEALSYADLVQQQQTWLQGEKAAKQLSYWKQVLADSPEGLDLPTTRRPVSTPTSHSTYDLALPGTLREALQTLSQREGVDLETTLVATLQTLLYRYSGQDEVQIGIGTSNRAQTESEPGPFENTLVMRAGLGSDLSFRALLTQVRTKLQDIRAHQELPFTHLLKELHPAHSPEHHPFFRVMFTLLPSLPGLPAGWSVARIDGGAGSVSSDLNLVAEEGEEGLLIHFDYRSDLFDEATIARMAGHWQTLLAGAIADPEIALDSLPLLTKSERHQLLVEWNTPQITYFHGRTVPELFEEQARRTPEAIAVVCKEQRLTYHELNQRANQLAHYLREQGVGAEMPVGICVERSADIIVGLLAILKAGGVYVPLDPAFPTSRIAFIMQDTGMRVLLTQQHLTASFPEPHPTLVCLDTDAASISLQPTENPDPIVGGEHLAYIIYTSGSTGQPKGVLIEHHAIASHCGAIIQAQKLKANDCQLQFSSFTFDASLEQMLPPLLVGAKLLLRGPEVWSPIDLLRQAKEHQITIFSLPCDYWHEVIAEWSTIPEQLDGQRIRLVVAGGDRLAPEAVQQWRQSPLSSGQLFNIYGPTEATIATTFYDVPRQAEQEQPATSIPIGRHLPDHTVYILDKTGQPVPEGIAGELYIGGNLLARGYLNRPELTAERFVQDSFNRQPHARLYKTGDLARYLPGGVVEFIGRADYQVKIRGYRIELGEIEAAIKRHPLVQQALVLVREDTPGVKRMVAYVVPQAAQETDQLAAQLRSQLKEGLPDYMVPAAFVLLKAFPLNTNGKIDRRALPQPDYQEIERQTPFMAPRTTQETIVAGILAETLGIEQISVHDDFFALGGHSLLAMQVISRMQKSLHVNVPLRRFFEVPTAAGLAEAATSLQESPTSSDQPTLRQLDREEYRLPASTTGSTSKLPAPTHAYPVSLTQEGLWFLHQLEPESTAYHVYSVLRISKPLDIETLERSLNALVERHETLRTTFGVQNGKPVQLITPTLKLILPKLELQHLPADEREAEARRLARAEACRPFDLTTGPLIRALLLRLAPEESLLLLTMHHIVFDGWSLNVLLSELSALYEGFASGRPSLLPDLTLQYSDFSVWQRELLQGERLAEQIGYWERLLANGPEVLELPFARQRPVVPTERGDTYHLTLPKTLSAELEQLSHKQGVTLYMTLVAAFQTLLYRYVGQEDLVIGTVAANRTLPETEALVGFFVNTLALRTDLSGDPSFTALMARVREVVLAAQAHQELPFASLVKAIQPGRQAGRNPLFQVMMSFDAPLSGLTEGWETINLGNLTSTAQFDLSLEVLEGAEGLRCHFEYSTDLFDEATITRLADHWQTLLAGIVADPQQQLSTLPILPEQERQQVIVEWNNTQTTYPLDQSLSRIFEAQVERTPNNVAVIYENEQLSYQELNAQANNLAHQLRERGVGRETLVALLSERGIPFLISVLAVFKAGGAYLPLDPHHPAARMRQVVESSHSRFILATEQFTQTLADVLEEIAAEQRPTVFSYEEMAQAHQSEENLGVRGTPRDLAYVIYTSGSTGKPKGAMVEQRGMINHLYAKIDALELTSQDRIAQTASQCFDISVWQYLDALLVGGSVQIYPDDVAHDPRQLLTQVEQHQVSILETVPSLLRAMLDTNQIASAERPALNALRWMIPTGEALPVELSRRWLFAYPRVPLLNAYGPTECSDDVTHYPIYEAPDANLSSVPIGRAIPNMRLYVLDRHLEPLPVGVSGELYVGGIGVGRGYLGDEKRTSDAFVPDPFEPGSDARLYKTGDLVRFLPDGNIEFLGRLDFQVKLRGFRIELGEIEAVLDQHPDVEQAVVMAREDTPGEQRLVAYVQPHKEQSVTAADLKSHVMGRVPVYMVPSAFILLETMPLTPNGKVDRKALPAPEPGRSVVEENYVAPRSPIEQQIVEVWEELLGVHPIGIKDDFFELGGDSLMAVQVFDKMAQVVGKKLPLSALYSGATIEQLAQGLGEQQTSLKASDHAGRAPLVTVQEGGSLPPFFYLHGEWKGGGFYSRELARHLGAEQPFYLLEPYLFDGLDTLPTFEEMATEHLKVMRSIQPEGPYYLSGYCNGALIAYEMAQQLQAQGQEVGLLLLMDPDFPARHGWVSQGIGRICDTLHVGPEKQFEGFLALQHVYRYLRFAHYRDTTDAELLKKRRKSKAGKALKLQALLPKINVLRWDWSNIYDWLVSNYTPGLYPGKITFFWTSEEPQRSDGWQNVMKAKKGEVEVYMNPGNHISGRTEYLPVLAERLRVCLKKAQEFMGK